MLASRTHLFIKSLIAENRRHTLSVVFQSSCIKQLEGDIAGLKMAPIDKWRICLCLWLIKLENSHQGKLKRAPYS
jgi:hypothetical protein